MPFDGSGNFNRVMNWVNDALAAIKIKADRHDSEDDNFASGLSMCITKDGQTSITADIPLNGHKLINVGNPSNPQDAMTLAAFGAGAVRYDVAQALTIAQQLTAHTNLAATASVLIKNAAYTLLQADRRKLLRITGAMTLTLPAASAVGNDFSVDFRTMGGTMTLDPDGTNQIEGVNANYAVQDGMVGTLWCDGTNWWLSQTMRPPPGEIISLAGKTAAAGSLKANGALPLRATYPDLFIYIAPSLGTCTITIASPGVVTTAAPHGMIVNDRVSFETTGALPTGLAVGTNYFVIAAGLGANTMQLSLTAGGAAINTTGTQSGVHTARNTAWGCGDGTTTFGLPDLRGLFDRGLDDGAGIDIARALGLLQADDNKAHVHTANALPGHSHGTAGLAAYVSGPVFADATGMTNRDDSSSTKFSTSTSAGTPVINSTGTEGRPKNQALLKCIRY